MTTETSCFECGRPNAHTHSGSGHTHDPGDPRCECGRTGAHVHKDGRRHRTAAPTRREAVVRAAKGDTP